LGLDALRPLIEYAYQTMISILAATCRLPAGSSILRNALLVGAAASILAGCAQQPEKKKRSKEYFPSSVYGAASERVVGEGEPVPRGGGQYLVGRPYTIAGKTYVPTERPPQSQSGLASYYGGAFHGRRTANGEVYDMNSISSAHPTLPLPSYVRVTNTRNGRSIIVRVNDRGPFHSSRVMDVSARVAEALDFKRFGTAPIKLDYIGKAGLAGSDDNKLFATLRTDGKPATLNGNPEPPATMVAEAPQRRAEPVEAPTTTVEQGTRVVNLASVAPAPPQRPFEIGPSGLRGTAPQRQAVLFSDQRPAAPSAPARNEPAVQAPSVPLPPRRPR
jgi:rare lipoprotein A